MARHYLLNYFSMHQLLLDRNGNLIKMQKMNIVKVEPKYSNIGPEHLFCMDVLIHPWS